MPADHKKPAHYFSSHHGSPAKVRKIFASVRNQTLSLQTAPEVFSPDGIDKGTEILIDYLLLPPLRPNLQILDLGAGYGPISLWVSKELALQAMLQHAKWGGSKIYASEVNNRAVWLLKRNIQANKAEHIEVLAGPFQEHFARLQAAQVQFDAVYTNPPLKTGHAQMLEMFEMAAQLVPESGFIQYVHKKKLGAEGFQAKLQEIRPDWHLMTIKKKGGYHVIVFSPQPLENPFEKEGPSGYF